MYITIYFSGKNATIKIYANSNILGKFAIL